MNTRLLSINLSVFVLFGANSAFSQTQVADSSMGKIIFAVTESNSYILMDDSIEVNNGQIFLSDTGKHTVKIWAPKHEPYESEFSVKNNVHLNRQFVDLNKREVFKKRRNGDIVVGVIAGVTLPILAIMNYDYKPFDIVPYEQAILEAQERVNNGVLGAEDELQIAKQNHQEVVELNNDNQKKADVRQGIVAGIFVAEVAGLTGYIIYRLLQPKIEDTNPFISGLEIRPNIGFNYQGMGLSFKF